jgi:hypothetical protein
MEGRGVRDQLATDFVRRIGPLYVTMQVTVPFFLSLHLRKGAEYVIVIILVLDPQIDFLPL